MRRIVTVLSGMQSDQKAASVAVALAKRVGAHVEGLTMALDATALVPRLGEGLSGLAIESVLEASEKASAEAADRATKALAAAAAAAGIEMVLEPSDRPGPSAHFRMLRGPLAESLDAEARLADLLVFGEPGEEAPANWIGLIEHVLLGLRRPTLVARGGISAAFGDKILVGYNGSLEAANALTHAAPILAAAEEIEVLEVREGEKRDDHAAAAVRYLRQHGANATAHEVKLVRSSIGEEICARANSTWASLIVTGGYGRSRLREFILGGATRHLIWHSPVPVLLCH